MSDALTYLMKIRPDAMQSYFDFIKKSGSHLDPKTRAIISLITKAHNQTETGVRQYLVRALQAGVTPDQIIDALLVAFPALGLSKIIWAIDIILTMEIPEFRPENLGNKSEWHEIADLDEIKNGVTQLNCAERDVMVYRDDDSIRLYDCLCPHQATRIPKNALNGNIVTCPKHKWMFDITTGQCIDKGNRPLHEYETKLKEGKLYGYW